MIRVLTAVLLGLLVSAQPAASAPNAPSIGPVPDSAPVRSAAPTRDETTLPLPVEVHAGPITVRAEAGMETLAAEIADGAPAVLRAIAADLEGLPTPDRIDIRLVKRGEDLGAAAPPGRGAPTWASGVAYPDVGVVVVAHRRGSELIDVESVVAHELAHLALGAATRGRAPRWLDEGFAYLHSSEWSVGRATTLTGMAWSGDAIPLAELSRRFPARESEVDRAYAQSYDFVAFLARRGRYADPDDDGNRWPFQQLIAAIAAGHDPDAAAHRAYGASLGQLADEWFQDLRDRYMVLPASLVGLSVWCFGALLLVLGYRRRRKQKRETLARWDLEERGADDGL